MKKIKEMKGLKPVIIELLKSDSNLRDSDNKLISAVWRKEIHGANHYSAKSFLIKYANNEFSSPVTISRVRRKVQEDYPELRGDSYEARHKEKKDVTKNIKTV